MTEPGLDRLRVDAGRDQQTRVSVPQVVEADLQAGEIQVPLERPMEVVEVDRPTRPRQEYVVPPGIVACRQGQQRVNQIRGQILDHPAGVFGLQRGLAYQVAVAVADAVQAAPDVQPSGVRVQITTVQA